MILRRFMQHMKEQNWFAVGLDVIVVIVGIFLGMQVQQWYEDRNNIVMESQYLQRLLDDVNSDLIDAERTSHWNTMRVDTQALVLESLRSGTLNDRPNFNRGFYWAGVLNPIQRRWHTVEELKSTGNLSILRDVTLRDQIAEIETMYMRHQGIISSSERRIEMLRVQLSEYYDVKSASGRVDGLVDLNVDIDELSKNQKLINIFSTVNEETKNIVNFRDQYYEALSNFKDELTTRLNN